MNVENSNARDLTISNGLGWSPDGGTMYLADSGPRVVYALAFDAQRGTIFDRRVLVTVAEDVGTPDGLTVDGEALVVPAMQSTSCAFAGLG